MTKMYNTHKNVLCNYYDYLYMYLFRNLNKYILKLNKTNTNNNSLNNTKAKER